MEFDSIISNIHNQCANDNKKIIEFKLGEIISDNIFNTNLDKNYINNFMNLIPKKLPVKYFYNTVYYYKNMQLIINNNGLQKCYKDYGNISKIDVVHKKFPIRILFKNRKKIDTSNFDCLKHYDSIINRELISISIKENIKINIYNKKFQNNPDNYYEITGQFLYNRNKKKNLEEDIKILIKNLLIYEQVENIEKYF
jgi:hypothetical protein